MNDTTTTAVVASQGIMAEMLSTVFGFLTALFWILYYPAFALVGLIPAIFIARGAQEFSKKVLRIPAIDPSEGKNLDKNTAYIAFGFFGYVPLMVGLAIYNYPDGAEVHPPFWKCVAEADLAFLLLSCLVLSLMGTVKIMKKIHVWAEETKARKEKGRYEPAEMDDLVESGESSTGNTKAVENREDVA